MADDREEIFRRWMAGQHPRTIAETLKITPNQVTDVIDEKQDQPDTKYRLRGWQRDIERIDMMIARNVRDALDRDLPFQHSQGAMKEAIRGMQRKAMMLGTDAPARNAVQIHHSGHVTTSSTDEIEAVLNRLITDQSKASNS